MSEPTRQDYINGMRQICDFLESHPDFKLPFEFEFGKSVYVNGKDEFAAVCERVVVRTEEIESEEVDPAALAALPKVTVRKQVDVVEWRCPELLNGEAS